MIFGAQPPVSGQGHKAEVQMGCFLVHVDNGRDEGLGILLASQEIQSVLEIRPDLPVGLILEKLGLAVTRASTTRTLSLRTRQ